MPKMRYVILQQNQELQFVEMPEEYAYQLSALNLRLNKEIDKLTADNVPDLPLAIAECDSLDLLREDYSLESGLDYINRLEQAFASVQEQKNYPLISCLLRSERYRLNWSSGTKRKQKAYCNPHL